MKIDLNSNAVKNSENGGLETIRERMVTVDTNNEENLLLDTSRQICSLNGKKLDPKYNQANNESPKQLDKLIDENLKKHSETIKKVHSQLPSSSAAAMLLGSTKISVNMIIGKNYSTNYYEDQDGNLKYDVEIFDIKCGQIINAKELPGKINLTFDVTDNGYKLQELSASNSLLAKLCLGNGDVVVTDADIQKAQSEEFKNSHSNLVNAIKGCKNEHLQSSAKHLLFEVKKSAYKNPELHADLSKKLDDTTYLLKNAYSPDDTIQNEIKNKLEDYKADAKQAMGKSSKLKMVGGAMLLLAGAAVCATAVTAAVVIAGPTAPLAAAGILLGIGAISQSAVGITVTSVLSAGVAAVGLGALSMFSGREKGVAKAMDDVAVDVEKSIGPKNS